MSERDTAQKTLEALRHAEAILTGAPQFTTNKGGQGPATTTGMALAKVRDAIAAADERKPDVGHVEVSNLLSEMVQAYYLTKAYHPLSSETEAMKRALALALQKASDLEFSDIKDVLPGGWHDLDTHACCFARWMGIEGTEDWLPKDAEDLKRRLDQTAA